MSSALQTAERPKTRIPSLDVIRGVSILGVLAVNADGFAIPIRASLNPSMWPFPNEGATAFAYWLMDAFFHEKFVALFSMLFGISLFLVGGELSDRRRGTYLARRLGALVLFALAHGFGLWWGDILSTYAVTGMLMFFLRSVPPKVLLTLGLCVFVGMACRNLPALDAPWFTPKVSSEVIAPPAPAPAVATVTAKAKIAMDTAEAAGSWAGAYAVNSDEYVHQLKHLGALVPSTLALMMIGLSLFKLGFFAGRSTSRTYWLMAATATGALALVAWLTWRTDIEGVRLPIGACANVVLAPIIALGYASLLMLALRTRAASALRPFAAAGRMAFTNYLTQSLIMTSIFYGGRGGLMGQVDRPMLWLLVLAIWAIQLTWSTLWLKRFAMGPLEWLWRWVTYGERSPFKVNGLAPSR